MWVRNEEGAQNSGCQIFIPHRGPRHRGRYVDRLEPSSLVVLGREPPANKRTHTPAQHALAAVRQHAARNGSTRDKQPHWCGFQRRCHFVYTVSSPSGYAMCGSTALNCAFTRKGSPSTIPTLIQHSFAKECPLRLPTPPDHFFPTYA